jgi:small subunit ribosomal protein S18
MTTDNSQFRRGGGNRRGFTPRPKICQFCSDKDAVIDYKDVDLLRRYVMEDGKIRPRRQTGTCAKHQRAIAAAVKKARFIALLPFVSSMED